MKYTKTTLSKIEEIFKQQGYTVRYEKGNFTSGYCLVEQRKIIIINRFYDTEGRINTLLDVLTTSEINEELFEEKELKFYNQLMKSSVKKEEEEQTEEK